MEKKIKIRIVIAAAAIIAAAIVILLSSGIAAFWINGAKYVASASGYTAKTFYSTESFFVAPNASADSAFGSVALSRLEETDNGVVVEITFSGEWKYKKGITLSAKPVFKTARDYSMKVTAREKSFSFLSQTVRRSDIVCRYRLEGATAAEFANATFTITDPVVNDYEKTR